MDSRQRESLDQYITGNYGEDQFREVEDQDWSHEMVDEPEEGWNEYEEMAEVTAWEKQHSDHLINQIDRWVTKVFWGTALFALWYFLTHAIVQAVCSG